MESGRAGPEGLDEAISALDGSVKNLTMNAVLNQIEGWRLRPEASGVPEPQLIADGLARLHDNLTSNGVDAGAVGGILADLGEQVRGVASTDVGRPVSGRLETLAGILSGEGRRLAGS